MLQAIELLVASVLRCFRSRRTLLIENLILRQQLVVLKRKHPRPRLNVLDKVIWVLAQRFWSGWKQALIIVRPETVVRVRRQTPKEVQQLIFRMVRENPTWGRSFSSTEP